MVAKEFFERDRVDFVPLLTRMLARGIDTIELDGNAPGTAGLIAKQARELGFKGKVVRTGGPATAEIIGVAGKEASEGMMVHAVIDAAQPSTRAYMDAYQAKYKAAPNGFSPSFYDLLLRAIFLALARRGVTGSAEFRVLRPVRPGIGIGQVGSQAVQHLEVARHFI